MKGVKFYILSVLKLSKVLKGAASPVYLHNHNDMKRSLDVVGYILYVCLYVYHMLRSISSVMLTLSVINNKPLV